MLAKLMAAGAVCVALTASPWAAGAAEKGFYVGGAGGYNIPLDSDLGSSNVDLKSDWAGLGALGYAFTSGLRLEGEFGFRTNDVDKISGYSGSSGSLNTSTFMTNLLYDFDLHGSPFTPYVGAGIGAAQVKVNGSTTSPAMTINDSDFGFAWQGIVGASYELNRYLALTADYRFVNAPNLTFKNTSGTKLDSDYTTNQIMLGLRFTFAAAEEKPMAKPEPQPEPKPMAKPAPPPAPKSEDFLVFFDFDSAKLTPEALNIVKSAAEAAKKGNYARIKVTGHADRAGPVSYNYGLSRRRADTVKAELVRLGVSATDIATEAKGETEPLVPTADGVPEPQNRRVEILMK